VQDQLELRPLAPPAPRRAAPPSSLPLENTERRRVARAYSAGRAEHRRRDTTPPLFMYVVGGKEKGQAAMFKRPISVWRLRLHPDVFARP
jgi:hypothetical protein